MPEGIEIFALICLGVMGLVAVAGFTAIACIGIEVIRR